MLVSTLDELLSVRARLKQAVRQRQRIGFDSEYDAPNIIHRGKARLDVLRASLVGYSLAFPGSRRGFYIPIAHLEQPDATRTPEFAAAARKLLRFVEVSGLEVWAHNWKSELHVLHNSGLSGNCTMLDSELCAWMCGWRLPGKGGLKLKALAKARLGYDGPTFEDIARGRKASEVPAAEMAPYAARDAVLTMALGELAWERMGELDLLKHYDIERRCIPVSAAMERTGVPLDEARMLADAERCEAEMNIISGRFHALTMTTVALPTKVKEQATCECDEGYLPDARQAWDCPGAPEVLCDRPGCVSGLLFFKNGNRKMRVVTRDVPTAAGADVGNDRQVARWLFDELKWWPTEEHPRNEVSWSVAEEDIRRFTTLEGAAGEAARLRLRFQALRKYASTYTRGLVDLARQSGDGRLHCSFKQDGTMTSRYSSAGPNLQNLPSSDRQDLPWLQDLPDTRACFMAAPGWRIVERDVKQGELRIAAHFSRDPNLLHVYRTGGDIHANTMEKVGCDRRPSKVLNFCHGPLTMLLTPDLRWVYAKDVKPGDKLVGFDEGLGYWCRFRHGIVEATTRVTQPLYKVETSEGVSFASEQHGWVVCGSDVRGNRPVRGWRKTYELQVGDELAFFERPWFGDSDFESGWLSGMFDGEGSCSSRGSVSVAQNEGPTLDRLRKALSDRGYEYDDRPAANGTRCTSLILRNGGGVRLLGSIRPERLLQKFTMEGKRPVRSRRPNATITKITCLGPYECVGIQTSTRTLVSDGFLTHNSTLYGISDRSLATKVHMATNRWDYTVQQAAADIEAWYGAYPDVRPWQARTQEEAESNRYAETITGFKEPLLNWSRFGRFGSERKAVNTRIQGSLGGLMKVVMVALYERWKREGALGTKVRFVAQVHDSLVFEAREDFADEANRVCGECMLWAGRKYHLEVSLESSGGVGSSWGDCK